MQRNDETEALRERLTGALVGLARAAQGNEDLMDDECRALVLEGLAYTAADCGDAAGLIDRMHEAKYRLVPSCAGCTHPCGRNDDYDMDQLARADSETRLLKGAILKSLREAAACMKYSDSENGLFLCGMLRVIGEEWRLEGLRNMAREAEEKSRKIVTQAGQN